MSPTTSHAGGSPTPANHTLQEQPIAATGQTMQRPSLTGYGGTSARQSSSSDSPVVSTVGQSYHPQSDAHPATSRHPVATNQDAPTPSSAVRPLLHTDVSSSSSLATNRSLVTESSVVRAGSKRTISNTSTSAPTAKRLDVGLRVLDGAPQVATSLLLQSVERQIASWASLDDPENRTLRHRYELLKLAASEGDWWFLTVHCLYSQHKFNQRAFCEALQFAGSGPDLVHLQASFELLTPLLPSPQDLDPRHLQWFALFPADDIRKLQQFAPKADFNEVMAFLRLFGSQWQFWVSTTSLRGYPLTVHELEQMHCTSPRMQLVLLTNNVHQLGALSALSELYQGLIKDQLFERLVSNGSVTYDQIASTRRSRADLYTKIVENHSGIRRGSSEVPQPASEAPQALLTHQHFHQHQLPSRSGSTTPASHLLSPPLQHAQRQPEQVVGQLNSSQHGRLPQQLHGQQQSQQSSYRGPMPYVTGSAPNQQQPLASPRPGQQWSSATGAVSPSQPVYTQGESTHYASGPHSAPQAPSQPQAQRGYQQAVPAPASPAMTGHAPYNYPTYPQLHGPNTQMSSSSLNSVPSHTTLRPGFPVLSSQSSRSAQSSQGVGRSHSPLVVQRYEADVRAQARPDNRVHAARADSSQIAPARTQQQNGRVAAPVPSFARPIPITDYPDNTWTWTSMESGMHMVRQRSPIREPREPTSARFYQYVDHFAATRVLTPRVGLQNIDFDIDETIFDTLVTMELRHGLLRCQYWEGSRRIRLRVCKYAENLADFETSTAPVTATYWPENIYISINDQPVPLRRKQHFRTDWPVELTGMVHRGSNSAVVSLPEVPQSPQALSKYLLMIEIVSVASANALRSLVSSKEHFSLEHTKGEFQRRLARSGDDEIEIQDKHLSISVTDPFSSTLCTTPVRSAQCKHLECFDLDNWLETRQSKPSKRPGEPSKVDEWKCPICGGDARPHQLRIDDFFLHVSKKLKTDGADRTKTIQMDDQGYWSAVVPLDDPDDSDEEPVAAKPKQVCPPVSRRRTAPCVIVLDDD